MSEYTPTTGQVRVAYQDHQDFQAVIKGLDRPGDVEAGHEFDRWLAQHDAEVKARALREAADALRPGLRGSDCNAKCHSADGLVLRARADQIEKENPR